MGNSLYLRQGGATHRLVLNDDSDPLVTRVKYLEATTSTMAGKLQTLGTEVQSLTADVEGLRSLEDSVRRLEQAVYTEIPTMLREVNSNVTNLRSDVTTLQQFKTKHFVECPNTLILTGDNKNLALTSPSMDAPTGGFRTFIGMNSNGIQLSGDYIGVGAVVPGFSIMNCPSGMQEVSQLYVARDNALPGMYLSPYNTFSLDTVVNGASDVRVYCAASFPWMDKGAVPPSKLEKYILTDSSGITSIQGSNGTLMLNGNNIQVNASNTLSVLASCFTSNAALEVTSSS